jgi:hypothetical protein
MTVELDTQVIELMGRHRLMNESLRDGMEIASPVRDRGVDVIAYGDGLVEDERSEGGVDTTTKPSERLKALIEPMRLITGRWRSGMAAWRTA